MNFNEFYAYCEKIFQLNEYLPALDKEKVEKLFALTERMLEVNKTMNLTAIKEEKAIIVKHYADSLAICPHLTEGATVIDVGCGAGFPTLPLAIFRPDLKITALDSTAKRINYVKETAKLLGLDNVTAIAERAEVVGNDPEYRESFDYATARAVAALPVLTELCLPLVKVGGQFVALKSQKTDDEIEISVSAIKKCGGELEKVCECELVDTNGENGMRTLVVVNKTSKTPTNYPRDYAKIKKKPL